MLLQNLMLGLVCISLVSCMDNDDKRSALEVPDFTKDYQVCYVPDLNASFYVDDVADGIKWHLKQGIYWESTIGKLIENHVKEGTVAIDVGAHIGIHTLTMSRKVGPKGQVIAFEPQRKIYSELIENLKLNSCLNVSVYKMALGNVTKSIQLDKRNPLNEGGTAIGKGGDSAKMITLDSLHLTNVSLIKIDVERYERFVFEGAKETILRNKPVIIFEVMGEFDYHNCSPAIKQQFDETLSFVESLGYKVDLIFGNDYIAFPVQ